MAQTQRVIRVC